jgi:hypothetical protein
VSVNTKQVTGRRRVRFSSYQDILDDVRELSGKPTRQLGNWSLGQICVHIAKAMDMAIDGPAFRPSLAVRLVGPFLKNRFLTRGISPGFKLPRSGAALLPDPANITDGLAKLEKSIARLQEIRRRQPHPVFGAMTLEEWDQLQLRHSEMHLGFIVPA